MIGPDIIFPGNWELAKCEEWLWQRAELIAWKWPAKIRLYRGWNGKQFWFTLVY